MTAPHPCEERAGRDLRLLRAAVFAAVCVVLSAVGHVLASYQAVPLWTVLAGFLGVFVVAVPLAGRARSLAGIAALLGFGQLVLHTVFGIGQHTGAGAASAASSDSWLIAQAAQLVCGAGASAIDPVQAQRILDASAALPGTALGQGQHSLDAAGSAGLWALLPTLPMLLGHVLSAAAAGWLLRRGDLALVRLVRLSVQGVAEGALIRALRAALAFVRAQLAGLTGAPANGPRTTVVDRSRVPCPRTGPLHHTVIRRGPPFTVAFGASPA
ncbi:hypothetical protein ACFV0R_03160 [Streptomyces sp. NPDC059578]|uniref:hypothetical protein n=1 Tax=Streptomyces sp. NPDC059578 TaxID=3346874 RepID=UPI0036AD84FA